ncbi:calmodulin-binding transcription activator 4-like isoform X2 [Abrus precatorius]|uniref:Calmodulin-binding transcription activator 4-like isoform X2 n=2 Tax=Abrus precatorius TaxID=3816 RepID=A0A8B8K2I4_ABRPR|nr:calmodulin-binding transcription activator 4-like isoform X2 [Abrus precatorius]
MIGESEAEPNKSLVSVANATSPFLILLSFTPSINMPPGLEYNIDDLFQEAKRRWLKPVEVLYILQNHKKCEFTDRPLHQPTGGSLFLFNRRVMRFFRKDGHNWRKKKDGRTVGEAHERLKVGNVEILNCYYAHGEENRTFQRRSYWILDPEYEHIVLVHYRETSEGNSEPVTQLLPGSSPVFSQSHSSHTTHNRGTTSMFDDSYEPNQNFSSLGSVEVTSSDTQALRQLEENLSLNEEIYDTDKYYQELLDDYPDGNEKAMSWMEVLESCKPSSVTKLPDQHAYQAFENEMSLSSSGRGMIANQDNNHWLNINTVFSFPQDVDGVKFPPYSYGETRTNYNYYATLFDEIQEPLGVDSSLTVVQKQKFTIRAVSPEYCYAAEMTKVIIIGTFLCSSSDSNWACMFGDVEVPAEIIQDGVICCEAPFGLLGKVNLCITSGNREPCSEVREFEFRKKTTSCTRCNSLETETGSSPKELLLLVRFAEMLLSASTTKDDSIDYGNHPSRKQKDDDDDDSWSHIIDTLLAGSGTSSGTVNWLLEELLKDKLQLWLSSRSHERDEGTGCSLSKKEQGIIHMVAGLGFEWALNPILSCGVNINFRDINGRTALHWAAWFGREKMVASLIASGASAGAVTDPTSQDPTGKTAASIAASHGHKGLAGYLSEVDLTSHLSSLTLEKNEIYEDSSLDVELTVNSVSKENFVASEDQVSLKASLDAVRNAAQAAARILAAFRAHSFRKQKEREAAAAAGLDGYGIAAGGIDDTISVLSARSLHDCNLAALSIQKKFRGYKGRQEFLAFRRKVVKIQACVRGYQVRKHYKVILWAVRIMDRVVLRWRRKRVGLLRVQREVESGEESDDEDFLKVFRKEKVHVAIERALKRVLSMVQSTGARQQYSRLLQMYRQAKVKHGSTTDEPPSSTSAADVSNIEDDDLSQFPWETILSS